jgi:DNA mismatch repair ATPase MutL
LFHEYSVRYSEWVRNRQKHLSKAIFLLQSYAIGFPEIKFKCNLFNQNGKQSSKKVLLSTSGGHVSTDTFMDVFGIAPKNFIFVESPFCDSQKYNLVMRMVFIIRIVVFL